METTLLRLTTNSYTITSKFLSQCHEMQLSSLGVSNTLLLTDERVLLYIHHTSNWKNYIFFFKKDLISPQHSRYCKYSHQERTANKYLETCFLFFSHSFWCVYAVSVYACVCEAYVHSLYSYVCAACVSMFACLSLCTCKYLDVYVCAYAFIYSYNV